MSRTFELRTALSAPAGLLWRHASSPQGINHELGPLLSMTFPPHVEQLSQSQVELGQRLFRSWLLMFRLIPIEYDDICLVELEEGHRFLERSEMALMRLWEHERTIEPLSDQACAVKDRLRFEPRLKAMEALLLPIVQAIFRHRHRRLSQRFGEHRPDPQTTSPRS